MQKHRHARAAGEPVSSNNIYGIATIGNSLFSGGAYGRWFVIFVGALAAIVALLSIPAYPLWSIAIFALGLWIIYGLVIYGEPEPTPASGESAGAPPTAAAGPRPPA